MGMNILRSVWRMVTLVAALTMVWMAEPLQAQAKKDDAAVLQTLRKAQGMLRQLTQEKADLEAQNTKLQAQIKDLEAKVKDFTALENEVKLQKTGLEDLRGQNSSLQQRITEDSERYRNLVDKQRATVAELKKHQHDNTLLVSAVAERTHWIEECTHKNGDLYTTNREMLNQFKNKGFWSSLVESEPFTQISQVRKENEVQRFQFKLEDLQVTPWQEPKAEAPSGEAAAPTADEDEEN
jgi:predicted RNase H-like nuclease (RuvC/YqgF family)